MGGLLSGGGSLEAQKNNRPEVQLKNWGFVEEMNRSLECEKKLMKFDS